MKCNFERLMEYLERRLCPDDELGVLEHLEKCGICFDTICELVRERAAFRALRGCRGLQIAGMKQAGTGHALSSRRAALYQNQGLAQDVDLDQVHSAGRFRTTSRSCARKGRRGSTRAF